MTGFAAAHGAAFLSVAIAVTDLASRWHTTVPLGRWLHDGLGSIATDVTVLAPTRPRRESLRRRVMRGGLVLLMSSSAVFGWRRCRVGGLCAGEYRAGATATKRLACELCLWAAGHVAVSLCRWARTLCSCCRRCECQSIPPMLYCTLRSTLTHQGARGQCWPAPTVGSYDVSSGGRLKCVPHGL